MKSESTLSARLDPQLFSEMLCLLKTGEAKLFLQGGWFNDRTSAEPGVYVEDPMGFGRGAEPEVLVEWLEVEGLDENDENGVISLRRWDDIPADAKKMFRPRLTQLNHAEEGKLDQLSQLLRKPKKVSVFDIEPIHPGHPSIDSGLLIESERSSLLIMSRSPVPTNLTVSFSSQFNKRQLHGAARRLTHNFGVNGKSGTS